MRLLVALVFVLFSTFAYASFDTNSSYYGREFSGHKMANGQIFNPNYLTVAHRTLPLGTHVKIINPRNGRVVHAIVTDRGPYVYSRSMDVSEKIATILDFKFAGTAKLHVEIE